MAVNNPSELACHLAVLDNTSPTLLSTQEANERPREIIEEFFYRREDNELGKVAPIDLLVKSPTGLGKMKKAMERATHQDDSRPVGVRRIDITDGGAVAQTGSCFRGTS